MQRKKGKQTEGPPTVKKITVHRQAGEQWLFMGPATYKPRVEVEVLETRKAHIILPDTALKVSGILPVFSKLIFQLQELASIAMELSVKQERNGLLELKELTCLVLMKWRKKL